MTRKRTRTVERQSLSESGRASRAIELGLAALISGGALFTVFVTDAVPQDERLGPPTPSFDTSQFMMPEASAGTRAVVTEVLSRSGTALRILPSSPPSGEPGEAASVTILPDVTVGTRTGAASPQGRSGSALGIELTARAGNAGDMPSVFIVGSVGRQTYKFAPYGLRHYALAPTGEAAVLGDAHVGIGVQLNDRVYAAAGYVREKRRYSLGERNWNEDEHYIGLALRARW